MTRWVFVACACAALLAGLIGVTGVFAVRAATNAGNLLAHDELTTAEHTAQLSHAIDSAYAVGQLRSATRDPAGRSTLAGELTDDKIPAVEQAMAHLIAVHDDDNAAEQADLSLLQEQWAALRSVLATQLVSSQPDPERLEQVFATVDGHVQRLAVREDIDAQAAQTRAADRSARTMQLIAWVVTATVLAALAVAVIGSRILRRAVEPAREQIEFGDTLQLAEDEDEAHQLLQRHLERLLAGSSVTVLNRNNSADRLEAVTELPSDSPLIPRLAGAEPRSCLAIRSGRTHHADESGSALLQCSVCSAAGRSTCSPLTVGGEVIGAVLVARPGAIGGTEEQQIHNSVAQAAPVLANLRNLAIAEVRAATDSLTGLPNKRAVADTLKRMLAQASRTLSPLSLLTLDLDHFKDINDRFGHQMGDQALANVGAALRSVLRDSDFAGRNGGEEFAILLPDTDAIGAAETAEKILSAIADINLPGLDRAITASIGIASYPQHATGTEKLERLADAALYLAKRSGRARFEVAASAPESSPRPPVAEPS